jgi:hypothetical protein
MIVAERCTVRKGLNQQPLERQFLVPHCARATRGVVRPVVQLQEGIVDPLGLVHVCVICVAEPRLPAALLPGQVRQVR